MFPRTKNKILLFILHICTHQTYSIYYALKFLLLFFSFFFFFFFKFGVE
ncbi:hypothetical protein ACMBCN_00495 [Candidatus Liberibacter asiaticus]